MPENAARTWVICPNLWGARLFAYGGPNQTIQDAERVRFLREFPRPKVQTKLEDFRDEDDASDIQEPVEDPALERVVAANFMQYLASELDRAREARKFESLIICAERKLLDIFQEKLGFLTRKSLIGVVPVDLYEVNETDLTPYVLDVLKASAQARSVA